MADSEEAGADGGPGASVAADAGLAAGAGSVVVGVGEVVSAVDDGGAEVAVSAAVDSDGVALVHWARFCWAAV